jgi:ferritin-like metal-binding protein YciE
MDDLFAHTLRDIYYAEQQIEKSLPKMIDKANDQTLRSGFERHLQQTRNQIGRLERVFEMEGYSPSGVRCQAIDGIIAEAEEIASEAESDVRDAALVAAAQAVEHYEITRYGTLIAWAQELGHEDAAIALLRQNLDEEKETDAKLTEIAEARVNRAAA